LTANCFCFPFVGYRSPCIFHDPPPPPIGGGGGRGGGGGGGLGGGWGVWGGGVWVVGGVGGVGGVWGACTPPESNGLSLFRQRVASSRATVHPLALAFFFLSTLQLVTLVSPPYLVETPHWDGRPPLGLSSGAPDSFFTADPSPPLPIPVVFQTSFSPLNGRLHSHLVALGPVVVPRNGSPTSLS